MFSKLKPDFTFKAFDEVTPEFLLQNGIHGILSDIDNTLAPYEIAEPDERIRQWIDALHKSGIKLALISNNHADRVELFNHTLSLPAYADCGKPGKKNLIRALDELGLDAGECAVLGDQLFTDAFAGKRLGMTAIIVPPIKDKKTLFFRFKRALEKPIMKSYERDIARKAQKSKK